MTRIYLVRHGETEMNRTGILQGQMNVPLSQRGLKQAELVGKGLCGIKFSTIFSSDLYRAYDTAKAILLDRNISLNTDKRLREINIGELQGKTQDEARKYFPEYNAAKKDDPINTACPGGESYMDLYTRATQALEEISEQHEDQTVLIVSHIGTIKCLLSYARGKIQDPDVEAICNTSVSILIKNNSGWHVELVNEIEHLKPYFTEEDLNYTAELYAKK